MEEIVIKMISSHKRNINGLEYTWTLYEYETVILDYGDEFIYWFS